MSEFWKVASSIPWFGWVPIVAIVCGCATLITQKVIEHRERMEQIRRGSIRQDDERSGS